MKTKVRMGARKLRVALVVLALIGVVSGTFWTAHHVADSVTITVTYYGSATPFSYVSTPTTVFTATITDPAKARAIQALWNETRAYSPFATFECAQGGIPYVYSFHFSFLGLPVQELKAARGGCGFFRLTTLGIRSLWLHILPRRDAWRQIVQLVGMPDFNTIWLQEHYKDYPPLPGQ